MIRYKYQNELSTIGRILRPVADVILKYNGFKIETPMYIDSGADITMIPFRLGASLGFKKSADDRILEIKGLSGSGVPYIIKKVIISLNNKVFKIRLAWALIEEVPILLGRMDIFNKFEIVFNEKKEYIDFI